MGGSKVSTKDSHLASLRQIELPQLQIFDTPPTLLTVESSWDERYSTTSTLSESTQEIRFTIPPSSLAYTDLYNSLLMLEMKVTAKDGTTALTADATVSVSNNALHTVISNVAAFINNVRVNHTDDQYPWVAYLENFLTNSDAKNYLPMEGYVQDTLTAASMGMDDKKVTGDCDNKGAATRAKWIALSKTLQMVGKLKIPSHTSIGYYVPFTTFDYILKLAPSEFALLWPSTAPGYKYHITKAVMKIRRVNVATPMLLAQTKVIKAEPTNYQVRRYQFINFSIATGLRNFEKSNLFLGHRMPKGVFVMFLDEAAYMGSGPGNPFFFRNYGLTTIKLQVGARNIPEVPYELDFTNDLFMEVYQDTIQNLGLYNASECPTDWTPSAYKVAQTIFFFDLTVNRDVNAPYDNTDNVLNPINLSGAFKAGLNSNVTVIVLGVYQNYIEIDSNYQVSTDW